MNVAECTLANESVKIQLVDEDSWFFTIERREFCIRETLAFAAVAHAYLHNKCIAGSLNMEVCISPSFGFPFLSPSSCPDIVGQGAWLRFTFLRTNLIRRTLRTADYIRALRARYYTYIRDATSKLEPRVGRLRNLVIHEKLLNTFLFFTNVRTRASVERVWIGHYIFALLWSILCANVCVYALFQCFRICKCKF